MEKLSKEQRQVGVRHMIAGSILLVTLLLILSLLGLCGLPL